MKNKINACAEAAQLLAELRQKKYPPVPASWFTTEQFAEHMDCSKGTARKNMEDLVSTGRFLSRRWPCLDCRGRTYYQTIYKKK